MKKLLTICLLIFPLSVFAQFSAKKTVICDKIEDIVSSLVGREYKEKPIWFGINGNTGFSVFVNKETNTWTIIEVEKDTACVLGTGEGFKQIQDKEKDVIIIKKY